jgi:putative transposase
MEMCWTSWSNVDATGALRSYRLAHRIVMPSVIHDMTQYANNPAELSHQPTRQREHQMRGFKVRGAGATVLGGARDSGEAVPSRAAPSAGDQSPNDSIACFVERNAVTGA